MATTRVWNITDDVNPSVKPQNLRVLGKFVAPGRFVTVEESALKGAHKVHADVGRGLLFIGRQPPTSYVKTRKPPRAKLADGVSRLGLANKPKPEPKKEVLELKDEVKVADKMEVALEGALEEPSDEAGDEDKKGRKRKGK